MNCREKPRHRRISVHECATLIGARSASGGCPVLTSTREYAAPELNGEHPALALGAQMGAADSFMVV